MSNLNEHLHGLNKSRGVKPKPVKIKPVSDGLKKELAVYRKRRDEYFKEHPFCEYPGCGSTRITLHHVRGRVGKYLTDKKWFKSLCVAHHSWAETHPSEAEKLGLAFSRLNVA